MGNCNPQTLFVYAITHFVDVDFARLTSNTNGRNFNFFQILIMIILFFKVTVKG